MIYLIIGYGSIGKVYLNILKKNKFNHIYVLDTIFKKKILKKNIYFSDKVSKYGYGEDQLFFSQMSQKGEVIRWNYNPVYEISQKKRENLRWYIQRNLKYGLTGMLIDQELHNFFVAYLLNIFKAFYNLFLAIIYFILMPINLINNFYKSFAYFLRFLGRIINLIKF